MIYVVNDVAAVPNGGGVYSILEDFYMDILKNDHENKWFFILAGNFFPESDNVKIIVRNDLKKSKFKKMIFESFTGRKFINKLNPDVYISLQNLMTYGVQASKKIVYLHQPIPFENEKSFSFLRRREIKLAVYQKLIGRLIKKSIHDIKPTVIVQTYWMKKATIEQCHIDEKYIIVRHPKINVDNENKIYHGNGKCFFYPASSFLYKNHEVISKAISILNKNKVNNFQVDFTLDKSQLNIESNNVNYIGHKSREYIMKKYETDVLIFPSYIESFGLPLVEAAVKGDIILASDTNFSHELLKKYDNVYFFRYNDAKELSRLMEMVINGDIKASGKKLAVRDNGERLLKTIMNITTGEKDVG